MPLHQLGWYMDFGKLDNMFQWIVELLPQSMVLLVRHAMPSSCPRQSLAPPHEPEPYVSAAPASSRHRRGLLTTPMSASRELDMVPDSEVANDNDDDVFMEVSLTA
ncbi:hypothetical protein GGR52DRAFT_573169 [Hypoxylon sp. FL1284]|nr:hypothetical protein GGR52DRAFT_573169 [Hypoxylon sp. FL1284]